MTILEKEDILKNFPIENLKLYKKEYFGYPETLLEKMTSMVNESFDWKNSKIAVMDDFGMQCCNYLHFTKNVKLENITLLYSEDFKENEGQKKAFETLLKLEYGWSGISIRSVFEHYNKNMANQFDLIIMNPPYGRNSAIARKVIKKVLDLKVSQIICIAPTPTFKSYEKYLHNMCIDVKNIFEGVNVDSLAIGDLSTNCEKVISFNESIFQKTKDLQLVKALKHYNECHPSSYLLVDGNNTGSKLKKTLIECNKKFIFPNSLSALKNTSLENCMDSGLVFYKPIRAPLGVHVTENCRDFELNYNSCTKLVEKECRAHALDYFVFKDVDSKKRFCTWWYSCNTKNTKKSLTNILLGLLLKSHGSGAGTYFYDEFFPHLDWSRPWTDEEIIQELKDKAGLPQDWTL